MSLILHLCVSTSARHRGVGVGAVGGQKWAGGAEDRGVMRATVKWNEREVQNRNECAQGFIEQCTYRFDTFAQNVTLYRSLLERYL